MLLRHNYRHICKMCKTSFLVNSSPSQKLCSKCYKLNQEAMEAECQKLLLELQAKDSTAF